MKIDLYGDEMGAVEYISHMGSDLAVVNAARVSFGRTKKDLDEKDAKLIKYLLDNNHTSPFEHCSVTFRFVVPLFIRSQHHRHRTWSYNEISRRYTSVDVTFYEPEKYRTQHKRNRQASNEELIDPDLNDSWHPVTPSPLYLASTAVKNHHNKSIELYDSLLNRGICREQARGILPQNLYTHYYGTVNLHNLLKFISLRSHHGAQWEIQQVASACLKIAKEHFPISVGFYEEKNNMEI